MYDNADISKAIYREGDLCRRPPLARYLLATLRGVLTTAMDALRFAAHYMPGHSTLSNGL